MEKITDRSGHTMTLDRYERNFYTQNVPLGPIGTEEFFDDDILLAAYPRSGSHWVLEMLNMLTRGKTVYDTIPLPSRSIEMRPVESVPEDFISIRPRFFHTHLPFHMVPAKLHKLRMIFVYRNPKDLAFSHYRFSIDSVLHDYDGCFEDFLLLFQEGKVPMGDYFKYMNSWENYILANKCYFSYEQLSEEPMSIMRKLAAYLNIKVTEDFLKEITEKCSLQNMKKNTTLSDLKFKDRSNGLLRKGIMGGWKKHFTVAMSEEFDKVFAQKMPNTQLDFCFKSRKPRNGLPDKAYPPS